MVLLRAYKGNRISNNMDFCLLCVLVKGWKCVEIRRTLLDSSFPDGAYWPGAMINTH